MSACTSRSRFCGFCNFSDRIYVIICGLRACKRVGAHKLFAMLGAVHFFASACCNLWCSSVQPCRRAQVVRDLVGFEFSCSHVMFRGLRAYKHVGAHKPFAICRALQLLCSYVIICGLRAYKRVGANKVFAML